MMRVLVLSNLYPNPSQPERALFNRQQLRALAAEHELRVIAPVAWTAGLRPPPRREPEGTMVEHPRYWFVPRMLRRTCGWCCRLSVQGCFMRHVRQWRPEVVYGTWAYPDGWAAVSLARKSGLPVVVKVHGSDVLRLEARPGPRGPRGLRGLRGGTIAALREADAVVAVSHDLAAKVRQLGRGGGRGRGQVHVVGNGVDRRLFYPGGRDEARRRLGLDERPLILFVGNLVPVKGLEVLIETCAALGRQGVRFQCCLIGQGPMRAALEARIARHAPDAPDGLGGLVRLMGPRPPEALGDWYRTASVMVLPSYSEGLPNVLLEAAACGTPIVASRVGGAAEIVGKCGGRLVEPGDAEELAGAIRCVLDADGVGLAKDIEPGWPMSWEDSARELGQVLRSVVRAARVVHRPCQRTAGHGQREHGLMRQER